MRCPYCNQNNTVVINLNGGYKFKCLSCENTFEGELNDAYKYAVMDTDTNSKFCKGVKFEILGYSKTYNQYYVRPLEGTVVHWIDADDLKLI